MMMVMTTYDMIWYLQILYVQESLEDHLEINLVYCFTDSWQVERTHPSCGLFNPRSDIDINFPGFSDVWDKKGIIVTAHYSLCINHHVKWWLRSHLAVFVKEKGKGQFCAILWGFGTGVLACVLNRFQVEIRNGESHSTCTWWWLNRKKINEFSSYSGSDAYLSYGLKWVSCSRLPLPRTWRFINISPQQRTLLSAIWLRSSFLLQRAITCILNVYRFKQDLYFINPSVHPNPLVIVKNNKASPQ